MPAPKGHPPYPGCEKGGRPKIYTNEFIDKEAYALEHWIKDKSNIFIEDFSFERGYDVSRINEFVKANEKFSVAYNRFKMRQKIALFKGGLLKKFSYPMCALLLGHNHGIYAKTEEVKTPTNDDYNEIMHQNMILRAQIQKLSGVNGE